MKNRVEKMWCPSKTHTEALPLESASAMFSAHTVPCSSFASVHDFAAPWGGKSAGTKNVRSTFRG